MSTLNILTVIQWYLNGGIFPGSSLTNVYIKTKLPAVSVCAMLGVCNCIFHTHFHSCFQKWREFIHEFEGMVEEATFGTLLRIDCRDGYTERNSMFCK